jgi:nicotinamidase-related amidase
MSAGPVAVAGSEPYPWPYDGVLTPSRSALVVAGAQRAWSARCADPEPVRRRVETLAVHLRARGVLVVLVRCAVAPGWEAADDPLPLPADAVVTAGGLDGFHESRLDTVLRRDGRDRLGVCGFGLEGPVHSTLRSANDRGYECLLLADACAAVEPALEAPAVRTVTMSGGIFGAVGTAAAYLAALAPDADP